MSLIGETLTPARPTSPCPTGCDVPTGKHSAIRRALSGGAALVVRNCLTDEWIDDPPRWWAAHGEQVATDDHEPAKARPAHAFFVASLWRSSEGKVVLMDENC